MKQQVDALLAQDNFREAAKRFVHVFQMDGLLKQRAADVHRATLDALAERSRQKCAAAEDPMQRIRLPEYVLQLLADRDEQKRFPEYYCAFLDSVGLHSCVPGDYVRQLQQTTQTSLSHLNLLLESLYNFSGDILVYYLA